MKFHNSMPAGNLKESHIRASQGLLTYAKLIIQLIIIINNYAYYKKCQCFVVEIVKRLPTGILKKTFHRNFKFS